MNGLTKNTEKIFEKISLLDENFNNLSPIYDITFDEIIDFFVEKAKEYIEK